MYSKTGSHIIGTKTKNTTLNWKKIVVEVIKFLLGLGYFSFFILALLFNFEKSVPLIVITVIVVIILLCRSVCSTTLYNNLIKSLNDSFKALDFSIFRNKIVLRCFYTTIGVGFIVFCGVSNRKTPENLTSLGGVALILALSVAMSNDRSKIQIRPVACGIGFQLFIGLFVLKTSFGKTAFEYLGHQVEKFLNHVTAGVEFVFGENYTQFYFAFRLLPIVIFLNSVISLLYFVGFMQYIVRKISVVVSFTMGTTAAETVSTIASIFLGQPEASLTIKPYLKLQTSSELHAIFTAGFASVSADIFGMFVSYGIQSSHILTAVLMSAPAGLAISKIIRPETEISKTKSLQDIKDQELGSEGHNIIDAAAKGAQDAVHIIFAVGATLIAFLSIISVIDSFVAYLGSLINIQHLTISMLFSYPLVPFVYLMGVPWHDCNQVAEVVALKTIVNEFVGFRRLGDFIQEGQISMKAQVIATYALCGFSNPTTIGVMLGGFAAMLPEKRPLFSKLMLSSWIAGSLACFMTACFAGLLYEIEAPKNSTFTHEF